MSCELEVRDLSKRFGPVAAASGVSLSVDSGEAVALLGPNGSGKTTTLRCVAGLLRADSGSVRFAAGLDLHRDFRAARRRFSFLPQKASFPPNLEVREVLEFHARLRGLGAKRVEDALSDAGFGDRDRDRRVAELSDGMRQRLSVAVTSLPEVPLMLLDEPTASLDPQAAVEFRERVDRWRHAGRAVLFSTHVLTDVQELADRVVVLVEGRVVISESFPELRARLERRAVLRVHVGRPTSAHLTAAREAGATDARLNSASVVIQAPVEGRHAILRRLEEVGPIHGFETEDPSLEHIYLDALERRNERGDVDAPGVAADGEESR